MTQIGDVLTPDDVAQLLRVAPSTLRVWRHRRKGPPWFPLDTGSPRYDRAAFEAWLAEQKNRAVA